MAVIHKVIDIGVARSFCGFLLLRSTHLFSQVCVGSGEGGYPAYWSLVPGGGVGLKVLLEGSGRRRGYPCPKT